MALQLSFRKEKLNTTFPGHLFSKRWTLANHIMLSMPKGNLCHCYWLSPYNHGNRKIFDKTKTLPHVKLMIQPILVRTYHKCKIWWLMPTWHSQANSLSLSQHKCNHIKKDFQYRKISLPFCSTLALIAIPRPTASGLQTGGHGRVNRSYNFSIKGNRKNKFQLVKLGAQLSIVDSWKVKRKLLK